MIRHPLSLFLAGLGAVGLVVVLVLLLPPVQRALAVAAIRSQGMSRVEIQRVRIRPGSLLFEGFRVEKPGLTLAFDRARVRGGFWRVILGGAVRLADYELEGFSLEIDADDVSGIADRLTEVGLILAPLAFELDRVVLGGALDLRLGSGRRVRVRLDARGGGFGDDRTGRLFIDGVAVLVGTAIEPIPFALTFETRREGGFRRVESSLKGRLGGDRAFAAFTLDLSREKGVIGFDGSGELDFRRLDESLGAARIRRPSAGRGSFVFGLASNASGESVLEGQLRAADLQVSGSDGRIDRIEAPFRMTLTPGSSWSLRAPVRVWRTGLESDLLVEATAVIDTPRWLLDGTLSGEQVRVEDLAGLGLLFMLKSDPTAPEAAWGGLRGRIGLDFRRVLGGKGLVVESFTAGLEFGESDVRFQDFDMKVGGGSLAGEATLGYDPESEAAYGFDGAWAGRGIWLNRAFSTAMIDGRMDFDLTSNARASDLGQLGEQMSGMLSVHGGPGVYRGLSGHVRTVSSVAGFIGSLFRSESLQAVATLSDELADIRYDSMELEAVRVAGKGLDVRHLLLVGPTVKLYGKGRLADATFSDMMVSPMHLEFNLGAKGSLAELFSVVGLLEESQPDWEGYYFIPGPFSVRGTPESPDFSELWELLRASTGVQTRR